MRFNRYLTEERQVDPAEYEIVTIASCAGHSFVITREIPEGESEDIEYLTPRSYAKYGWICHGTHISNAQSILRTGLDVDYGVRAGLARRNMIHFCVATNQRPLKRQGLYCYLDLKVAIGDLGLKVNQQRLHDAMLSTIFKSVFEDIVPDSAVGIYSSGKKDRMGCEIPKIIDFRSLPVGVQDDLMRAEILLTMWPQYQISGYERMFHCCLMTVIRRRMLFAASCHSLTPAGIDNMYPPSIDEKHRAWIMDKMFTPSGPQDAVDQLIHAAFESAVSILREAGSPVRYVIELNAYQLDVFLFKDMGIGGILAKFISRMNECQYENYFLPEPVATWYRSFYTDYMTYLDIAGRDSVLAAQAASPGSQVTIQFIAMALEQAEDRAREEEQSLNEYLENPTMADTVEQFTQDENCAWLVHNDFFIGNNGSFATVREVSGASHDIMMGDTISSDVSMGDADSPREEGAPGQAATMDDTAATAQSGGSQETAGLYSSSASAPRTIIGVEAPPGLLAIEDVKPDEYYCATDQIRSALQNLPEQIQQHEEPQLANWVHTTEVYSKSLWTDYEFARKACDRIGARIHFAIRSLEFGPEHPHTKGYTKVALPGLLPYLDDYIMMAPLWRISIGPRTITGTQSPSRPSSLRAMCRSFCFLQIGKSSSRSGPKQQDLWSRSQEETPEA